MIAFPRSLAKRFRSVLRRCVTPADFSREPLIVARTSSKGLSLQAVLSETAVRFDQPGNQAEEVIAFPASLLAKIEGPTDDLVSLEVLQPDQGRAAWREKGAETSHDFKPVQPNAAHCFPAMPARLTDPGEFFKLALEEAAGTASREIKGRSLHRVLLRGKTGEVIATDGGQLLIQSGFNLPWKEDLLVPCISVWGLQELAEKPLSIACSKKHVFVHVGMWSFALTIERGTRFPHIEGVVPPPDSIRTRVRFRVEDLALLKKQLPSMPGAKETPAPVMLHAGKQVTVNAQGDGKETDSALVLPGAKVEGKPVRVEMDRRHLLRVAKLGFLEIEIASPSTPLCCRQHKRTFVWMPLGEPKKPPQQRPPQTPAPAPSTEENSTMSDNNGRDASNGQGLQTGNGICDPLAEAEAIKGLLTEAQSRLARLIASLKYFRKQSRAVRAAVQSLQQLPPLTP